MTHATEADLPGGAAERSAEDVMLPITIRRADGREVHTERSAIGHRAIHLAVLHARSDGYVELAAGRRANTEKVRIYTRKDPRHFLPAGGCGDPQWRAPLLALAASHHDRGDELFLGVAPRCQRAGNKQAVRFSQWLWLDIDGTEHLGRLDALLQAKPAHLLVESAGSGGMHAYWRLAEPLPARQIRLPDGRIVVNPSEIRQPTLQTGRTRLVGYREPGSEEVITLARKVDSIERANLRLIHALGYTRSHGRQVPVGDRKCREQARVLRWAGSLNGKTGKWARIVRLDLCLAAYRANVLVGDLPDPPRSRPAARHDLRPRKYDPYRLIPSAVYFPLLANIELPEHGKKIRCPSPKHEDREASCSVDTYVFCCHGCEAQGTIYDLWSLRHNGPAGNALSDDKQAFARARQGVRDECSGLL